MGKCGALRYTKNSKVWKLLQITIDDDMLQIVIYVWRTNISTLSRVICDNYHVLQIYLRRSLQMVISPLILIGHGYERQGYHHPFLYLKRLDDHIYPIYWDISMVEVWYEGQTWQNDIWSKYGLNMDKLWLEYGQPFESPIKYGNKRAYIYKEMKIKPYIYVSMQLCIYKCMYACIYVCTHVCVCMYV